MVKIKKRFHEDLGYNFVESETLSIRGGFCKSSQNSVVRMGGRRFGPDLEFILDSDFWILDSRKTARFCKCLTSA